jgi:DNA-binding CsgD family transcriptional regulator
MVGVTPAAPREFVKAAVCRLSVDTRSGVVDASQGELAWELVPHLADPLLETAFENIYSEVLALATRYVEALEVATKLLVTAQHYRLDFARPHGLITAAMAHAGMRNWQAAASCLDEASAFAKDVGDAFAEQEAYAIHVRVLAQQGSHSAALALPLPDLTLSVPVVRAQVLASRALALAGADRLAEAQDLAVLARSSSGAVESIVLPVATTAIASLKCDGPGALAAVKSLELAARETGALDLLVSAYRTVPDLLAVLLRDEETAGRTRVLVQGVGDDDLLRPLGFSDSDDDPCARLTSREREVYDLVCRGFSNRQIAALLVISPATAKLHVQRIFDKLGVHSRTALAFQAAVGRVTHATSATHDVGRRDEESSA